MRAKIQLACSLILMIAASVAAAGETALLANAAEKHDHSAIRRASEFVNLQFAAGDRDLRDHGGEAADVVDDPDPLEVPGRGLAPGRRTLRLRGGDGVRCRSVGGPNTPFGIP